MRCFSVHEPAEAYCLACDWTAEGIKARDKALRHAATHSHDVKVEVFSVETLLGSRVCSMCKGLERIRDPKKHNTSFDKAAIDCPKCKGQEPIQGRPVSTTMEDD